MDLTALTQFHLWHRQNNRNELSTKSQWVQLHAYNIVIIVGDSQINLIVWLQRLHALQEERFP